MNFNAAILTLPTSFILQIQQPNERAMLLDIGFAGFKIDRLNDLIREKIYAQRVHR
jgi:hypothetical protein